MFEKILKQLNFFIGIIALGILFGFVFQAAQVEIRDLDLWLHWGLGKYITQTGMIPHVDMLSWTMTGKSWIDHEWLFQVVIYNIQNLWGWNGLLVMQGLVVLAILGLLFFMANDRNKQIIVILLLYIVATIMEQRFTVRPDLFSLLFFSLYIFVLALHLDKKWAMPFLVFIQIIWVNVHGFFFFGPLFVLIGILSEFIKRKVKLPWEWNSIGRLNDSEYKNLKIMFGLMVLACFVNPYFWRGAGYPVDVFISTLTGANKVFFAYIQELKKPLIWRDLFSLEHEGSYKLMILFSGISFIFNRRKVDISALFLWLLFLGFSLGAVRNLPFFAVAAYLVFITNIYELKAADIVPVTFKKPIFIPITEIAVKLLLMVSIFNAFNQDIFTGYYDFDTNKRKSEYGDVSLREYPSHAVDFLVENKIKGKFFNDFNSGAYLIGRAWPNIKVFIDGRTEFYGKDFFENYIKVWQKGEKDAIKKYVEDAGATGAFLNSARQNIPKETLRNFYNSPNWKVIYFDWDAVIFLRDIEENKALIKQFGIDLAKWQPKEEDIYKLRTERVRPFRNQNRADMLLNLKLYGPAMAEAKEAMKVSPGFYEAHYTIGRIYFEEKKFKEAFPYLRFAAAVEPSDDAAQYDFAECYYNLKMYDLALKQYNDIKASWPKDLVARYWIAKVLAKQEKYEEAFKEISAFHKSKPKEVLKVLEVGDIAFEQKNIEQAKKIYDLVKNAETDKAEVKARFEKLKSGK
ncbi:MAG: tetratricopeptide repeat protein [Candidatus Omnitrophica bacterium]|nr:tetratricopeptide repeat protein [Candidatus Omnitrophota bacterium]